MTYCDSNLCSNDCQSVAQDGGFCDTTQNKCYCFKQVIKKASNTSNETVEQSENEQGADKNP